MLIWPDCELLVVMGGFSLIFGAWLRPGGSGRLVLWSSSMYVNLVNRIPILYWWCCFYPKGDIIVVFPESFFLDLFRLWLLLGVRDCIAPG